MNEGLGSEQLRRGAASRRRSEKRGQGFTRVPSKKRSLVFNMEMTSQTDKDICVCPFVCVCVCARMRERGEGEERERERVLASVCAPDVIVGGKL